MPVDELQRGMVGVGRTVFQGTDIDSFGVEILGVLRNVYGPRSDIILARLAGGPLEKTGVISGMSGSPVYIDGKLIGAVAYRYGAFAKEPIAGITPIGEMVGVLERPLEPGGPTPGRASWPHPDGSLADSGSDRLDLDVAELRPIATPLVMSGFTHQVVVKLRDELLPLGLLPVQGGGGNDESLPPGPFEPGAALGVQLMRGDLSATGIGTLTYRDGERIIGFGHPMLHDGNTAMPMTAAYIHEVLPSQYASFKLGTASRAMGVIVQDRAPGIAGIIGRHPTMMPTRIEIASGDNAQTFHMELVRNRVYSPILMRGALFSSLISAEKLRGEATVRVRTRIALAGRPPLKVENVYAGPSGMSDAVRGASAPLALLMQNPFEPVQVEEMVVHLGLEERVRAARIESIRLEKARYNSGDTVRVAILLQPYLGTAETIHAEVMIPPQARKGKLTLRVSSARVHRALESKRVPGEYTPTDLDHLIRLLGGAERNDRLILELLSPKRGVTVDGREMPALPPSVLSAYRLSRQAGTVKPVGQTVLHQARMPTDYVLSGSQAALIFVDREAKGVVFEGKPAPRQKQK